MVTTIRFYKNLIKCDPANTSVLIVGKLSKLRIIQYEQIKCKLEPRVTEEIFKEALLKLRISDSCSMYLNSAIMCVLPCKCSRHNTPSRCHALTRLITLSCGGGYTSKSIVIVCEYEEMFASGCAVGRAFRNYSKKTNALTHDINVSVEFIIVPSGLASPRSSIVSEFVEISPDELRVIDYTTFGIRLASRITDTPCSEMGVDHFLQEIDAIGALLGIRAFILRGSQLSERGFGGIYGVGKGANDAPALAVLSYTHPKAEKTIAWVGKGIVFDTGGLSLKSKNDMIRMKQDCGGAAALLGAFYATVKLGFAQNLHAIFCLAENSIGPSSTRPDDIHTLYSGRTVEINNTDAEGRLVLADGVVYAKRNLNASIILDMATLTGAQAIATGKYHAALLTNNEKWEDYCMQAGRISGDLVFPIPYAPELHFQELESIFADMKNTPPPYASCSCAGLFIASHLGFDFPGVWIHIDMASPVHNGEKATGYGVALLCILFGNHSNSSFLNKLAPKPHIDEVITDYVASTS